LLTIRDITKSFGANRALDDVSLDVAAGEIVAIVGENGAGKTTLMRIVAGELVPDFGSVALDGSVAMVHQHFMLVNELTIAENLALALPPFGFATRQSVLKLAEAAIAESGIELGDVRRRVGELSVGEKSKLELIKAIARKPRLLVLDEPTSVLTPNESEELFRVIRALAASGTAIVFISHKLPEVLAIAQRIVVMRGGRVVAESAANALDATKLADAMVARRATPAPPPARSIGDEVLRRDDLAVRSGEIVAIIGVAGNGQAELAESLRELPLARRAGFIPEDRTRDGLVAEMSIAENIALSESRWRPREAMQRAARLIETYAIRAQSPAQPAGALSGGNQQKVILARELDRKPLLLVAAEPTRGLDIESTRFVHDELRIAAAHGSAVLLITSDLDEAFALADALHVIYRGRLSARLSPVEAAERAPALMAGVVSP
jgi:simple sugar transport system ATP-binding protein